MFFPVSGHHSTVEISQKFFGYLQVRGLPKATTAKASSWEGGEEKKVKIIERKENKYVAYLT
ncbi:hypothetical protein ES288_A04G149300v1 [Gossypium darwinii]|nr:hypothetical protein ES288_A04G149300v1 [Gossypium darwinii]